MDLAILFWFYKEPEICVNHLKLLKKSNPRSKVYGLYGGKSEEENKFKEILGKYLTDFYSSPYEDEEWKWIHGDLVILDWYEKRGKNLTWDSVVIVQWDMLVFDSFKNQFPGIKKDEIFLSGLKLLDKETENRWDWTRPKYLFRKDYLNFLDYVKRHYGYHDKPLCCVFILEVFPRIFFAKYLSVKDKEIGMLEYKIPIYATIFSVPFYKRDLGVCWYEDINTLPMNARPIEISLKYIRSQLKNRNGWRIFHPYLGKWPPKTDIFNITNGDIKNRISRAKLYLKTEIRSKVEKK
jgi:hypothetical protein